MRLCYLSRNYKNVALGGGKAKTDIEQTLAAMGAVNLGLRQTRSTNKVYDFVRNLTGVLRAMWRLQKGDVLVLQYPVKKWFEPLCKAAHRRQAKVVAIIHDLGSFRRKRLTVAEEIARLNHADVVIAPNPYQQQWLLEQGCRARVTVYGLHDYLSDEVIEPAHPAPEPDAAGKVYFSACFVGNLSPKINGYLYRLADRLHEVTLHLYGSSFAEGESRSNAPLQYHGFGHDMTLMRSIEGDFGISWYGESIAGPEGALGEYMAFNNPHKVSLYLRCGIPLIIWRKAGLGSLVEQEGIGLVVDSLEELEKRLTTLTLEEYRIMQQNVRRVVTQIAAGGSCRRAVEEAISVLQDKTKG